MSEAPAASKVASNSATTGSTFESSLYKGITTDRPGPLVMSIGRLLALARRNLVVHGEYQVMQEQAGMAVLQATPALQSLCRIRGSGCTASARTLRWILPAVGIRIFQTKSVTGATAGRDSRA